MVARWETFENPVGLDGIEFVEFTGPDKAYLEKQFAQFGFQKVASHKSKKIDLYRQNDINILLNFEETGFAKNFAKLHGPSICSMGFRVKDKEKALATTIANGAREYTDTENKTFTTDYPSIYGIGDSLIYFIDEYRNTIYEREFDWSVDKDKDIEGFGYMRVDHLTNNVPAGKMQDWCDWYTKIFNFKDVKFFDIKGEKTGLISKVMLSPCNKIIIPINEPTDDKSQIQEYIEEYKGSGIQHLALLTPNIIESITKTREQGVQFLEVPDTYYEMLPERLPNIEEPLTTLQQLRLLADGDEDGYLLQIFTQNLVGPIFFEVIQRKNHYGFGEGNFQALFDAIERDQERRGVL